jgi:hypothetical protein
VVENLKSQISSKAAALTTANNRSATLQKENDELRIQNERALKELDELRQLKQKVES